MSYEREPRSYPHRRWHDLFRLAQLLPVFVLPLLAACKGISPRIAPSQIAYGQYEEGVDRIVLRLMNADGTNDRSLVQNLNAGSYQPAWSADGQRLAYQAFVGDENWEVFVVNPSSGEIKNLSNDPAQDYSPSWGPDGDLVYFVSNRDGDFEIMVGATYTDNPWQMTQNSTDEFSPVVSADGKRLVYTSNVGCKSNIFVINSDGSSPTQLTYGRIAMHPGWAPDSSTVLFAAIDDDQGDYEIYTINLNTRNERQLTDNGAQDVSPSWSPDGTRIAFESYRDNNSEIYVIGADGTDETRLTHTPAMDYAPKWSFASDRIAWMSSNTDRSDIFIMDADGANQLKLTHGSASSTFPAIAAVSGQPNRWVPVVPHIK